MESKELPVAGGAEQESKRRDSAQSTKGKSGTGSTGVIGRTTEFLVQNDPIWAHFLKGDTICYADQVAQDFDRFK